MSGGPVPKHDVLNFSVQSAGLLHRTVAYIVALLTQLYNL